MRNIKIGDKLQIHCYKHDGTFHRTCDEATVLDIFDNGIVCANYKTQIIESTGKNKYHKYYTKEPAIIFFYCNIASPYIIDDGVIKYIDYDLDLRVFPDGAFKVLDRNEYRYHKKKMNYSADLEKVIQYELSRLIDMKRRDVGPFDKETVKHYNEIYQKIRLKKP